MIHFWAEPPGLRCFVCAAGQPREVAGGGSGPGSSFGLCYPSAHQPVVTLCAAEQTLTYSVPFAVPWI